MADNAAARVELGLDTFGDVTATPEGKLLSHAEVIRGLLDQAVLADEVGVDFLGVGEHHRADFAVSAPETVLAGIATRTRRIRLGSAVTVLSSDEPVRVFQRFSTLDALSNGRAEVILGRGSFTESFPLFGYELRDYERLFEEKLDLFVRLAREQKVTWSGTVRAPLKAQEVFPPVEAGRLKTWVGVGGSPESVIRAVNYGLPMMLAIIGGDPRRFLPYADLYRRGFAEAGEPVQALGVHSPGFVGETDEAAKEGYFPAYKTMHDLIGAGRAGPLRRADFEREASEGSLYVGSPETVARKIAATVRALGADRFDLKYSAGPQTEARMMTCVELYGRRVIPMVRDMLS